MSVHGMLPLAFVCPFISWVHFVSGCLVVVFPLLPCFAQVMLAQFQFPSPFSRAYLESPQLLQDALARIQVGPFQTDGELLCLMFLTPVRDDPDETGVTLRPWTTFRESWMIFMATRTNIDQ